MLWGASGRQSHQLPARRSAGSSVRNGLWRELTGGPNEWRLWDANLGGSASTFEGNRLLARERLA